MKLRRITVVSALLLLTLAACASQPYADTAGAPGFLMGLIHGLISWIALIAHIFFNDIRIYAFPNSGGWYDFGFLTGVAAWGGGLAALGFGD